MHPPINLNYVNRASLHAALWGGVGFAIGHLADTSPLKCAAILAISSIVKNLFSILAGYAAADPAAWRGMYTTSNVLVEWVTVIALVRLELIGTLSAYGLNSLIFIKTCIMA